MDNPASAARADVVCDDDVAAACDDALLRQVALGDAVAFRTLVDRHHAVMFRIGWRMLGQRAEAEDIVQDALTRLWVNAATLDPRRGAGGWLHRVTVNLCLDRLRRRRFVADVPVPDRADDAAPADVEMDRARLAALTSSCVAALPDRQRAAIVLTYFENLSNNDAATALDLNLKAFESLLLRARSTLRGTLAARGVGTAALA